MAMQTPQPTPNLEPASAADSAGSSVGFPAGWPGADGVPLLGGLTPELLAARVGSTPFYAYDRGRLAARVSALRSALPASLHLHYAIKANPMPALVAWMARQVDGLDVASGGELRVALDAGADPQEISFAGPGKRVAELHQAVASGVLVNVESARELGPLEDAARSLGRPARVALRVNAEFELKGSGMRMAGGAKPFGIDSEAVPGVLALVRGPHLQFEGFHFYAGSQCLNAEAIVQAQRQAVTAAAELAPHAPAPVRVLNIGGGFGIPYFSGDVPLDLAQAAAGLHEVADLAARTLPRARLVLELGRYLVGEAGLYVARIVDKKVSHGQCFLVCDGGLHHHLAASGNFGQVLKRPYPITIATRSRSPRREKVNIVGPLCTPLDRLGEGLMLPEAEVGDLVIVFQSGAYGPTASPQAFLGHPPCVEVLV